VGDFLKVASDQACYLIERKKKQPFSEDLNALEKFISASHTSQVWNESMIHLLTFPISQCYPLNITHLESNIVGFSLIRRANI
jgi:hypothetical protein